MYCYELRLCMGKGILLTIDLLLCIRQRRSCKQTDNILLKLYNNGLNVDYLKLLFGKLIRTELLTISLYKSYRMFVYTEESRSQMNRYDYPLQSSSSYVLVTFITILEEGITYLRKEIAPVQNETLPKIVYTFLFTMACN